MPSHPLRNFFRCLGLALLTGGVSACGIANRTTADSSAKNSATNLAGSVYYSRAESIMGTAQVTQRLNYLFGPASGVVHPGFYSNSGAGVHYTAVGAVVSMHDYNYSDSSQYTIFDSSGNLNQVVLASYFPGASTVFSQTNPTVGPLHYIGLVDFEDYLCNAGSPILDKSSGLDVSTFDNTTTFFDPVPAGKLLPSNFSTIKDEAIRFPMIAIANAWQMPVTPTSPEVAVLSDLYRYTRANPPVAGSSALVATQWAKKVLCMATIDAPQFWFGAPDIYTPFINIANRVAIRDLTAAEKTAIASGSLTPKQFMDQIQKSPTETGFRTNMRNFLTNWFAFSGYISPRLGSVTTSMIPQLTARIDTAQFDMRIPLGSTTPVAMDAAHKAYGILKYDSPNANTWENPDGCVPPKLADATYATSWKATAYPTPYLKEQAFNPDASILVWDAYNPTNSKFEVMGGWIRDNAGARAAYETEMQTTYGWTGFSTSTAGQCVSYATDSATLAYTQKPIGVSGFIRCHGRMSDAGGTFHAIDLNQTNTAIANGAAVDNNGRLSIASYSSNPSNPIPANILSFLQVNNNWSYTWLLPSNNVVPPYDMRVDAGKIRVRRFAYNSATTAYDDQNGYSTILGYFTNQPMYVCNTYHRFLATCQYRRPVLPGAPNNIDTQDYWYQANILSWNPAMQGLRPASGYQSRTPTAAWAHPDYLNHMACGVPNPAAMTETPGLAPSHNTAYSSAAAYPVNAPYQDVAVNFESQYGDNNFNNMDYFRVCESGNPECAAQTGLGADVIEEPYRLFWDTVDNHRDFRKLLTADYTFVKPPLKTWYQGGAFPISVRPPAYRVPDSSSPWYQGAVPLAKDMWNTPMKVTQAEINLDGVNGDLNWKYFTGNQTISANIAGVQATLYPKTLCGIFCMPAFYYGMQNDGARGTAARIFSRVLGIQASDVTGVYDINSQTITSAPHADIYGALTDPNRSPGSANFIQHLTPVCMTCHSSIDPLGAAMYGVSTYGGLVASNGTINSQGGEIGGSNMSYFGGPKGQGAFLGAYSNGFADIARQAANSRYFAVNVVNKLFNMLYQRDPSFDEVAGYINPCVDFFMDTSRGNYDFYLLMQYMVSNTAFSGSTQ